MTQPVILTCAQPTGSLHLGNYLGAVRHWIDLLQDNQCFFGIVDLHAITVQRSPEALETATLDCVAQYLACGLDPKRCAIFAQSQVIGHTELAWLLACITPLGQLQRMTQFKDKAAGQQSNSIGAGLLYYPVLMAADILLYNADRVPVGKDQKQHLELTRDLAIKFNQTYGETFTVPEPAIAQTAARVMSLQNPEAKMSKSDPNQRGTLYLTEAPEQLRKKIMSAVTDTGRSILAREDKPGITNLLHIISGFTQKAIDELEKNFEGQGYGAFKKEVADAVIGALEPIRKRYLELAKDKAYLSQVLKEGASKAQERASPILETVFKKVGFCR